MAAEDFENIIGKRFKEFGSEAPEKVWDGVEAHLDSKKKKRRGAFWWFTGLAATIGFGAVFLIWNTQTHISKHDYNLTSTIKNYKNQENPSNISQETMADLNTSNKEIEKPILEQSNSRIKYYNPPSTELINKEDISKIIPHPVKNSEELDLSSSSLLVKSLEELPTSFDHSLMQCLSYGGKVPPMGVGLGVHLNTFANLSNVRLYTSETNTPDAFAPEPIPEPGSSYTESYYHRQFEIEPFLRIESRYSYSAFRAQLLYGRSSSSVLTDTLAWRTTRNYIGAGIGYDHALTAKRLQLFLYGTMRWEYALGKYKAPEEDLPPTITYDTYEYMNQSRIKQHLFSAEVGIKTKYYLSTQWSLHGSIGYRNYLYQQRPSFENVTRIPQLLRIGIGATYTIR